MSNFVMLVGLPASGKSKLAEEYAQQGYKVHASDKLREELFGNVNEQDKNNILFQELHRRIKESLEVGLNVVYDATNLNWRRRKHFLHTIKDVDCYKECILVYTEAGKCITRDLIRDKTVGHDVIERMYKTIYIPQYYEGWDNIKIHYTHPLTTERITQVMSRLMDIDQETPYHNLTIGDHCFETFYNLTNGTGSINMIRASLLHDIGKEYTKRYHPKKEHYVYYQHQLVGAYQAIELLKSHFGDDISDYDLLETVNYIQWHMQPFYIELEKTKQKYRELWGEEFYNNLMLLHEADKKSKGFINEN